MDIVVADIVVMTLAQYLDAHPTSRDLIILHYVIARNIIKRCIIKATFVDCSQNEWYMNYWGRGRVISKVILGLRSIGRIKIPWINLDLKPLWWPI